MDLINRADRERTAAERVSLGDDLRALYRAFYYRRKRMAWIVAGFAAAGLLYVWTATPGYRSTVEILIDPRERNLVEGEVAPTGLGSSSLGADTALVESQVGIITSRSVLTALIEQHGLAFDPEFGLKSESLTSTLASGAKALFYGPNYQSYDSQTPLDRAMEKLLESIDVERMGNTYILSIGVTTEVPAKSAALADSIAAIYIAEGQTAANGSSEQAALALEGRLEELRAASEAAQQAVEAYRVENGLIGADNLMIDEAQLRDLHDQVTQASVAVETARTQLDEIRRLAAAGATVGTSILSSALVQQLRTQLDLALADERSLSATMGPQHPTLIRARERRVALESALSAEFARVVAQAESDYDAASANEQSLRTLLDQYEGRQADANSASVQLTELQRIADTRTAVYQSYLTRAIEARQQIALPASTARIISPALPSSKPSSPKVTIVMGLALFLGVAVATGLAWLQHLIAGTPAHGEEPVRIRPPRRSRTIAIPRFLLRARHPTRPAPADATVSAEAAVGTAQGRPLQEKPGAPARPLQAPAPVPARATQSPRPAAAQRSGGAPVRPAGSSRPSHGPGVRQVVKPRRTAARHAASPRPTLMKRVLADLFR